MQCKECNELSRKHPSNPPEGQPELLIKGAELLLESNYMGKGQPLLQLKSWGQDLTRKWPSFSEPRFSRGPQPEEAAARGGPDALSLPK